MLSQWRQLRVGSLVLMRYARADVPAGAFGLVYERYAIANQTGISVLFANGNPDGLCEVEWNIAGGRKLGDGHLDYAFVDLPQLFRDYQRGVFDHALDTASSLALADSRPAASEQRDRQLEAA